MPDFVAGSRSELAEWLVKWQGAIMAREQQSSAGGVFIAIAIFVGAMTGAISGEPSIGVIAGAVTGIILAVIVWLRDRRRVGH